MSVIKNDASYKAAQYFIETNPAILDLFGTIEGYGDMPQASIDVTNQYGEAKFTIPFIGSKKNGTVILTLEKKPGEAWYVTEFHYREQ